MAGEPFHSTHREPPSIPLLRPLIRAGICIELSGSQPARKSYRLIHGGPLVTRFSE